MYLTDKQQDLMDAVLDNNQRKVAALLKKGVDPDFADDNGRTPLNEAVTHANLAMIKAIVTGGADVNRAGAAFYCDKPLDVADRFGNVKIIEFLEQKGATSSDAGRLTVRQQALLDAIDAGDTRKAKALLDKGLDPDFADSAEATPLDEAIRRGNATLVRALVDAGADVNRVNSYKEAPLDVARQAGEDAIAQYLESEGAVTGKPASKSAHNTGVAGGLKGGFKEGRGRSAGIQDNFDDDDFFDGGKYYFGAGEDAGRGKKQGAKPKIRMKAASSAKTAAPDGAAPAAARPEPRPVFREDTLKDIFNAKNWVDKTEKMEELWNEVPRRLQKHFDFAAALAAARRNTLKQNAPKKVILPNPPRPLQPPKPPVTQSAPQEAAKEAALKPLEPPKPGQGSGPNV